MAEQRVKAKRLRRVAGKQRWVHGQLENKRHNVCTVQAGKGEVSCVWGWAGGRGVNSDITREPR